MLKVFLERNLSQLKNKLCTMIYFLVFLIQLLAIYFHAENLFSFTKPLIAMVLMLWLYQGTQLKGRFHKRMFTGLIFALFGDIFFMIQPAKTAYFVYGLLAFLLCHVFYIRAFTLDHKSNPHQKNPFFLWAVGGFAIFCSGLFFYLQPHLNILQFPVLMYAILVAVMAIMAVNRLGKVNVLSYRLILGGALFFMLSESLLAINKFAKPVPMADFWVMASYMLAQYLIIFGAVERKLVVTQTEI